MRAAIAEQAANELADGGEESRLPRRGEESKVPSGGDESRLPRRPERMAMMKFGRKVNGRLASSEVAEREDKPAGEEPAQ